MTETMQQARRRLTRAGIDFQSDGGPGFEIYRDKQRIGRVYSEAGLIAWREEPIETPSELSANLQDCARRYVAAQRRSGDALLEACAALFEARQLTQHGEWGRFLEATRTSESAAKRLIDIHIEASRNESFADAVRSNWIGATVAGEIAQPSLPAEARAALLSRETPPTVAIVTQARRAGKSSIMEDLKPVADVPSIAGQPIPSSVIAHVPPAPKELPARSATKFGTDEYEGLMEIDQILLGKATAAIGRGDTETAETLLSQVTVKTAARDELLVVLPDQNAWRRAQAVALLRQIAPLMQLIITDDQEGLSQAIDDLYTCGTGMEARGWAGVGWALLDLEGDEA